MIVMAREFFKHPKTGPCGALRFENIYPIGYIADYNEFQKAALSIVDKFYESEYNGGNDVYGLEWYEGSSDSCDCRGHGRSLYMVILDGSEWILTVAGDKTEWKN
jgi:hypothetical protein